MLLRAFSSLTSITLLASRLACLAVIAWFVLFAIDQSNRASHHQRQEVAGVVSQSAEQPADQKHHPGWAKKTVNEIAKTVTKPFDRAVASSTNPWVIHGVKLALTLFVYGLAVGFVLRMIRIRV